MVPYHSALDRRHDLQHDTITRQYIEGPLYASHLTVSHLVRPSLLLMRAIPESWSLRSRTLLCCAACFLPASPGIPSPSCPEISTSHQARTNKHQKMNWALSSTNTSGGGSCGRSQSAPFGDPTLNTSIRVCLLEGRPSQDLICRPKLSKRTYKYIYIVYTSKYDNSFWGGFGQDFFFSPPQYALRRTGILGQMASFERRLRGAPQTPLALPYPFRTST